MIPDKTFFTKGLDLGREGLERVKERVGNGDWPGAREAFASFIRNAKDGARFFAIPYEEPENKFRMAGESDREACERIARHVMVSVGRAHDFGENGAVDWSFNPTGDNFKEWTWQLNRHNELKLLAHEYRETGEERLAEAAAELLSSWLAQTGFPPKRPSYDYRKNRFRTIECGIRLGANWPYAFFAFRESPAFTSDILVDWVKAVWEQAEYLSKWRTRENWLIMEMNGLAHAGILFPEFRQSGAWVAQALGTLAEEIDRQFYPDGFHYELTTNYHEVALNNYARMIRTARAFGVPVPENILSKFTLACEADVKLMMPDGRLPDINDGERLEVKKVLQEKRGLLESNGPIDFALDGRKPAPDWRSVAFPYAGFLVMRTGWGAGDAWALFDAGPLGKAHAHEDKLSVLFHHGGKLLLTEGGNYAYDKSDMRRYFKSTAAHNTVLVDGCGQNRKRNHKWRDGDIGKKADFEWTIGESWDSARGSYSDGYGEKARIRVTHERKVFFNKRNGGRAPALIVVDRLMGKEPHDFEWLWHVDGAIEDIGLRFSAGTADVVCGQTQPEVQGFVSTGSNVQGAYRAVSCVRVRERGDRLRLVTAFAPADGRTAELTEIRADRNVDATTVTLCYADGGVVFFDEKEATATEVDGVRDELTSRKLIVSFTSYPPRIPKLHKVVDSICDQTRPADEVILWLAESQFPKRERSLPLALRKRAKAGKLTIRWCDDLRPHKKYFYAFQEHPEDVVVTIDDDVIYPKDTLERLYNSYLAFPRAVSAMRTRVIPLSEDGKVLPYRQWRLGGERDCFKPSFNLLATGVSGVLYPPGLLPKETFDKETIVKTCLNGDDLWLKTMELVNGVPVVCAARGGKIHHVRHSQKTALWNANVDANDVQLNAITDHFAGRFNGNLWERKLSGNGPL